MTYHVHEWKISEARIRMIDSHIHLSGRYYDQTFPYIAMEEEQFVIHQGDRDSLIAEMKHQGIECCIEPATDVDSNELLLKLSQKYKGVIFSAAGNHPTRCIHSTWGDFRRVRDYSESEGVVAIGETGLDYHYDRKDQHRLKQKIWFHWQINLADKQGLPLILHIRKADKDAIRILRKNKKKLHGGVCHCFSGGADVAQIYTKELGLHLGIGGAILAKPEISTPIQQAVASVPMQSILLETDGPYVRPERPEGITGKQWTKARNTSLIIPAVAKKIAEIKGISCEEVLRTADENTRKVFDMRN